MQRQAAIVSSSCSALMVLQIQRRTAIKSIGRIEHQMRCLIGRCLGWNPTLPEDVRTELNKAALKILALLTKGKPVPAEYYEKVSPYLSLIMSLKAAAEPVTAHREEVEKKMAELSMSLPVWKWVESVNGLGPMSLAIVIGEAGDLNNYPHHQHLWKRLGCAPPFCYRKDFPQKDGTVKTADAIPKQRRAWSYMVADSLLKAKNIYRDLYLQKREGLVGTEFCKGLNKETGRPKLNLHGDRRCRRYAEQAMLRDLWQQWRKYG